MIALNRFLEAVRENAERITHYQLGGDGRDGGCDCIGLIIGAVRLAGGSWPGTHGSNWAARNAMKTLGSIKSAGDVFLGEIVYKAKEFWDEGWALPDAYEDSADQRDYFHVGVVTSLSPLVITHCTGVQGGIKRDTALGAWRWGGQLKYVEYKEESMSETMYKAKVRWPQNDYPVKMRREPNSVSEIITRVPQGTVVDVLGEIGTKEDGMWGYIRLEDGTTGYMMLKFLERINESPEGIQQMLEELDRDLMRAHETIQKLLGGEW